MSLNEIVNVTIDRQTRAVSQAGFGTVLLLGSFPANITDRYRTYTSAAGVEGDFPATSAQVYAARAAFGQSPAPTRIVIGRIDSGDTPDVALTEIANVYNDWYGVILLDRDRAKQQAVAAWVEGRKKLFVTSSADVAISGAAYSAPAAGAVNPVAPDLATHLRWNGYNRSAVLFSKTLGATDWPDAAWLARQLSTAPGTQTWMFKSLAGVTVSGLSDTESNNVRGKNANTYETVGGVPITREGKVGSGEFLDVIHGLDWLQARLTERVFGRLVNLPKVPYTDAGVAIFESEIRAQLATAVELGVLAGEPTVTVPRVRDVSPNDRANRFLPDIRFSATLSGAVHSVTVNGVVSV